ncbi:uncharacterized protein [Typha latifolia]|uniref:uncharacterized protein n=1 Tax=Typha latifolia TaxID=4733 RepID=UPI003C2C5054
MAIRTSGGIIVLWKTKLGWVDILLVSRYAVHWVLTTPASETGLWMAEKKSSKKVELGPKSKQFKAFVEVTGLCDLGYEGLPSTCSHPHHKVLHLDRSASDHAPLLLAIHPPLGRVARPFRFELHWLEYEGCRLTVKEVWRRPMLMQKVSYLQCALRRWSRSVVGNLEENLATTNQDISKLESLDVEGLLNEDGLAKVEVSDSFTSFFTKLWSAEEETTVDKLSWPQISTLVLDEGHALTSPVHPEEIKTALWNLPRGKAPGPDELQVEVYMQFWDTMGDDLTQAVEHFFSITTLPSR